MLQRIIKPVSRIHKQQIGGCPPEKLNASIPLYPAHSRSQTWKKRAHNWGSSCSTKSGLASINMAFS